MKDLVLKSAGIKNFSASIIVKKNDIDDIEGITNENELYLKKCDDNYVGKLEIINGRVSIKNIVGFKGDKSPELWFSKEKRVKNNTCINDFLCDDSIKNDGKRILIILESPHIREFEVDENPKPAVGATGYALESNFLVILNEFLKSMDLEIEDGYYHVFLMNAIEYQCSLGLTPSKYRDIVFKSLWEQKEITDRFNSRLKKYAPFIIISLCTKGNKSNFAKITRNSSDYCHDKKLTMRNMVLDKIVSNSNLNQKQIIIRGCHPSSWNRRKAFRKFHYVNVSRGRGDQ